MERQVEPGLVVVQADEQAAEERAAGDVEQLPRVLGRDPHRLGLARTAPMWPKIDGRQLEVVPRRPDHLLRLTVDELERRAPGLVTTHDLDETAA